MSILNRMIGWIKKNTLFRPRWRHLVWGILLAGLVYTCLPFCFAAGYTWDLLQPACLPTRPPDVTAERIAWHDATYGAVNFWYVAPRNGRVLILVGGRNSTVEDWQEEIDYFYKNGFGLAILADPACDDLPASLGLKESKKILSMVSFLKNQAEVTWLGGMGFSAGASALALAAPQVPEFQALALMGNFADLRSEILYTPYPVGSFGWMAQKSVLFWYRFFSGYPAAQISPIEAYAAFPALRLLLVHGEKEAARTHAQDQYRAAIHGGAAQVNLWIVPDAGHGNYESAAGEEYLRVLAVFFLP